MQTAPIPSNEKERMEALHRMAILDTAPEKRFDYITNQAAAYFNAPISMISIIDSEREWYKSCYGLDIKQNDRSISFCGHALLATEVFIVEDTMLDERFKDNPSVIGKPFIRFYAGVALKDHKTKLPIGVFCIKDIVPRKLTLEQVAAFLEFGKRAEEELNKTK